MSIFDDNVNPRVPTNESWNNLCYNIWMDVLNDVFRKRWSPKNMWFSSAEDAASYTMPPMPWQTKSQMKNRYKNYKKLSKDFKKELDEVLDRIYQKYGVFAQYKIQYGSNKMIKSIYFIRVC